MGAREKDYTRSVVAVLTDKYGLSKKKAKDCVKGSMLEWALRTGAAYNQTPDFYAKLLYDTYEEYGYE